MTYVKKPMVIENTSFDIITEELGEKVKQFTEGELKIVKRLIHTTADFEYAEIVEISKDAIERGKKSIENGSKIYCDTNMIVNGLSKKTMEKWDVAAYCLVSDDEVVKEAKERGLTRSIVGMEKAMKDEKTKIFLIGNAPTALFTLMEAIEKGYRPDLVVGVPVGFVGAEDSKEKLRELDIPYIITRGRKGGSTVAVATFHGILYDMYERKGFLGE